MHKDTYYNVKLLSYNTRMKYTLKNRNPLFIYKNSSKNMLKFNLYLYQSLMLFPKNFTFQGYIKGSFLLQVNI